MSEQETEIAVLPAASPFAQEIDIIASQTGIDDKLHIERVFMECRNDISSTIIKLMNLIEKKRPVVEPNVFDEIRVILNEKDALYHDIMARKAMGA